MQGVKPLEQMGLRLIMQKKDAQFILDFFAESMEESEFFRIAILLSSM